MVEKISDITVEDLKVFCRIDDSGEEDQILATILRAGKQFVLSQTGLTAEQADTYSDLTLAVLMFCSDAYDNRHYSTEKKSNINPAVKAIIDQYCMNLL